MRQRRRLALGAAALVALAVVGGVVRANGYLGGVDRHGPLDGPGGVTYHHPTWGKRVHVLNLYGLDLGARRTVKVDSAEVLADPQLKVLGVHLRDKRVVAATSHRWPPRGSRPAAGASFTGSKQLAIGFAVPEDVQRGRLEASGLRVRYRIGLRRFDQEYELGYTICTGENCD